MKLKKNMKKIPKNSIEKKNLVNESVWHEDWFYFDSFPIIDLWWVCSCYVLRLGGCVYIQWKCWLLISLLALCQKEEYKTQEGVNCVLKFFRIIWQPRNRPCLDKLFLEHPEAKLVRKEIIDTRFFTWKASSPTEVKNHDLPLVGFSYTSLTGLKNVTIYHPPLQLVTHSYNLLP